jgi:hypothetical protein
MGKAQRAHQSQSVPMGTGFRPLPILPQDPIQLESWPGKLAQFRRVPLEFIWSLRLCLRG